ncbi:MAG: HAD-IC family P-type ATPase, partial [Clostridiales bacterium]|nr:HAD-IC family P-type ATPase [Clostridiales bacterium]
MNQIPRLNPSAKDGLSSEQVQAQKQAGLQNTAPEKITQTTGQIIRKNVCTLFNLFNLLIALALAAVHAWSNLFFMAIIALNTAIGIFQEIQAKKLVDKLSLLSAPKAQVVRDGQAQTVAVEELVLDDVLCLEGGRQICADAILLEGEIEVNESLLTGESDPVAKRPGDMVLSGSFVLSGKCRAKVEHIGAAGYATKIAEEAKAHRKVNSELLA